MRVAAVIERLDDRFETLIAGHVDRIDEAIDAYMEHVVHESVDESAAELRNLLLLAVSTIGGQEKTNEFNPQGRSTRSGRVVEFRQRRMGSGSTRGLRVQQIEYRWRQSVGSS